MKKAKSKVPSVREPDDMRPEYDFSGGQRNKYAARYAKGSIAVVLEPDVAAVFRSAAEVNAVLRVLAGVIRRHKPTRAGSRRSA